MKTLPEEVRGSRLWMLVLIGHSGLAIPSAALLLADAHGRAVDTIEQRHTESANFNSGMAGELPTDLVEERLHHEDIAATPAELHFDGTGER